MAVSINSWASAGGSFPPPAALCCFPRVFLFKFVLTFCNDYDRIYVIKILEV